MTMPFAVSNIALPAFDHESQLAELAPLGISGLEVAPSRVWQDTWKGLAPRQVDTYRRQVEAAGLTIVGLHSLLFDHKHLSMFGDTRDDTLEFMAHLSGLCRDLGGRTLIYGGGRSRGALPVEAAFHGAVDFMHRLLDRTQDHGTVFCFEPLGPRDTDFINTVGEAMAFVRAVDRPGLAAQIDAKALVENDEAALEPFLAAQPALVHYHANEPGLGVLGSSGNVDHALFGACLRQVGYHGYVSIEQRMLNAQDPMADIRQSAALLHAAYGT